MIYKLIYIKISVISQIQIFLDHIDPQLSVGNEIINLKVMKSKTKQN